MIADKRPQTADILQNVRLQVRTWYSTVPKGCHDPVYGSQHTAYQAPQQGWVMLDVSGALCVSLSLQVPKYRGFPMPKTLQILVFRISTTLNPKGLPFGYFDPVGIL